MGNASQHKAENDLLTASKRPNASFGMWADRVHVDPAAYVRAIRRPRHAR
jgi:hypothetical protein